MCCAFPNWQNFAVRQRRPDTGCIPTGYEMLLRAAGALDIDFDSFQDDFDLDKDLKSGESHTNNFESVADAVRKTYPRVNFRRMSFAAGKGADKLKFVEDRIVKKQPVLVSIAQKPFGGKGWHIMPVVDAADDELVLLKEIKPHSKPKTLRLRKDKFVWIHNQYNGGDDVAYLKEWK